MEDNMNFYLGEVKKLGYRSIWEMPTYVLWDIRNELAQKYPGDDYVKAYEEEIAYRQRQEQILRGE